MKNKKIAKVVKLAKEYVEQGYKYGEAVAKAQKEVEQQERDRYEK